MQIKLGGIDFRVVDTKEKITIADSFVVPKNKIGGGHGEAKLYVGNDNADIRNFFGNEGFAIPCFLLKRDLLQYLEETKFEYLRPEQPYVQKEQLPTLWEERKKKVQEQSEIIEFVVNEQTQLEGPRIYVNSSDKAYQLIRELSLPNITYISVIKLIDAKRQLKYYFRLFADYFGEVQHPYIIEKEQEAIEEKQIEEKEKVQLQKARFGQGEYRMKLLDECPFCPITLVSDDRLLNASHIKPWAISNEFEKTDPKNGFMFTPTIDRLFDRGFLSFTNDKKTILSPFLSNMTYSKLGISDNRIISHLPVSGREKYLEFHRTTILKK
jgi:putative restriction endonuclease